MDWEILPEFAGGKQFYLRVPKKSRPSKVGNVTVQ
jgi:hypothetical protein